MRLAMVVGATAVLLAGCTPPSAGHALSVRISLLGASCEVASGDATISGFNMQTIGPVPLTVSGDELQGTVDAVPVGEDRVVTVNAYDAAHTRVYTGSTTVQVLKDQVVSAAVSLHSDPAGCPDTGTVVIVGTIDDSGDADGGSPDAGLETGGTVLSGEGLAFSFTEAELAPNGVLYFLDPDLDQVHRLDLNTQTVLPPLQGTLEAQTMALTDDGQEAYLSYVDGRIDAFDLDGGTSHFFAAAPGTVSRMVVAGPYLFTHDPTGAWGTNSLFDRATGGRVFSVDWRNGARAAVYSPLNQKVYYLDQGVSPTDIHMAQLDGGALTTDVDSPYHGAYSLPNPLRLLPDESGLIVGSGLIFNAADLTYRTSIGLSFVDIAFLNGNLYLVDQVGPNTQLRTLDGAFSLTAAAYYPGVPERLFTYQGQLVLVTLGAEGVEVRLLDPPAPEAP